MSFGKSVKLAKNFSACYVPDASLIADGDQKGSTSSRQALGNIGGEEMQSIR